MSSPSGLPYSISGYKMMVDEKGNDVDMGAKPDFETVSVDANGVADYSKLYDVGAIRAFLNEYYAKVTPTRAAPAVDAAGSTSGTPIVMILLIAIPVVLVAAAIAVVILILRKRRTKPTDTM